MEHRLVIVAILLLLSVYQAEAQYEPGATADLGMAYGQIALSQSILSNTANLTGGTRTGNVSSNVYIIKNNAIVAYKKKFASQAAANNKGGDIYQIYDRLIDLEYAFNDKARTYRLNTTRISDRLTTYVAWCWEIYHQQKPSPAKIVNFNNKIMTNIATSDVQKRLVSLSDQEKANWLLDFVFHVAFASAYSQKAGNDSKVVTSNRANLAVEAQQLGVDIKDPSLFN